MIQIKEVSIKELKELKKISTETFLDTFGKDNSEEDISKYIESAYADEKLAGELSNKNSFFFFAIDNERVIGYLKLNINEAQSEKLLSNSLEVERIYILPECKGKGTGKTLIQHAIAFALSKEKDSIWLGVWEHNKNALRFYEKMGFKVIDEHIFVLGQDEQTDLIMKKDLIQ